MSKSSYLAQHARHEFNFNKGWEFQEAETKEALVAGNWRSVELPHDWSVEHSFAESHEGATGYLPGGIGWYRKSFSLTLANPQGKAFLLFDGIYNHSELFLNGQLIASQVSGYAPFVVDITEHLLDSDNRLEVKVDHSRIADSRWYTGSGIYRDVKLITTSDLFVPIWSHFLFAEEVTQRSARLNLKLDITNLSEDVVDTCVYLKLLEPQNQQVISQCKQKVRVDANSTNREALLDLSIAYPKLWSPETPKLYLAEITLEQEGELKDKLITRIGFRDCQFVPEKGFLLNGQPTKLKGVCLHHDAGLAGAAVPDALWRRRLLTLKAGGVNAIRIAHNPASDRLLDLCDEIGLLVQDEFFDEWDFPKDKRLNMNDQHGDELSKGYAADFQENAKQDLTTSLLCHRNHPSVFMWSIGNEIEWTYPRNVEATGFFDADWGGNYFWSQPPNSLEEIRRNLKELPEHEYNIGQTAQNLAKWTRELDPTRTVTANCILPSASYESGYADALDVIGFSYRQVIYDYGLEHYPHLPIVANEALPQWHEWRAASERPHVAGVFLWTGIDYMGEVHNQWPTRALASGILDTAGFEKTPYYLFKSLWTQAPMVHLETQVLNSEEYQADLTQFTAEEKDPEAWKTKLWIWPKSNRHWNYEPKQELLIQGFTNCEEVELLLNEKSLGKRVLANQADRILKWALPFEAGILRAIGFNKGRAVAEQIIRTASEIAGLEVELNDDADLGNTDQKIRHLVVQAVDAEGVPVSHQETQLTFELSGNAKLLGVDNGAPDNVQDYQGVSIKTAKGRALAVLKLAEDATEVSVTITSSHGATTTISVEV